jgi:hypothetical protein
VENTLSDRDSIRKAYNLQIEAEETWKKNRLKDEEVFEPETADHVSTADQVERYGFDDVCQDKD